MTTAQDMSSVLRAGANASVQPPQSASPERMESLSGCDEMGRSPLLVAGLLGRTAAVRELAAHGAQLEQQTATGYTALHLATCWGHVDTVQMLLKLGADTKVQNSRGERPIDLARKYSRQECEKCLFLGEAKQEFASYLAHIKDVISRSESSLTKEERISGESKYFRATKHLEYMYSIIVPFVQIQDDFKEQKNLSSHVFCAKTEWLQTVTDPQVSDFTDQTRDLEESLQHILNKLSNT